MRSSGAPTATHESREGSTAAVQCYIDGSVLGHDARVHSPQHHSVKDPGTPQKDRGAQQRQHQRPHQELRLLHAFLTELISDHFFLFWWMFLPAAWRRWRGGLPAGGSASWRGVRRESSIAGRSMGWSGGPCRSWAGRGPPCWPGWAHAWCWGNAFFTSNHAGVEAPCVLCVRAAGLRVGRGEWMVDEEWGRWCLLA